MDTRVLVIEDDLEINELLGEYLKLEKIGYLQALTGQAGIHLATAEHPDVIILDLMLPDIDGMEVARTLSTRRDTCEIPIIIHSCMSHPDAREKAFKCGAHTFKNKPCPPDDLLAAVASALEWKAAQPSRLPAGHVVVGGKPDKACALRPLNQMQVDLLTRGEFSEAEARGVWEAVELLGSWVQNWNQEHPEAPSELTLQYRISGPSTIPSHAAPADEVQEHAIVEWKLSENTPGLLWETFFKKENGTSTQGSGLIGWGANILRPKPAAPAKTTPNPWSQILTMTGASAFEPDPITKTVRFARVTRSVLNAVPA